MTLSQKKLQKKKQRKQNKRKDLVKQGGKIKTINAPWRFPMIDCLVPNNLWERGLGQIVIAHRLPQDRVAGVFLLVDVYCLGLKDCFVRTLDISVYREYLTRLKAVNDTYVEVVPVYVKALINSAIEYAAQFDLNPPETFTDVQPYLEHIDDPDEPIQFKFGRHGKPFYVAGEDSLARVESVISALRTHVGDGEFSFMAPIAQPLVRES